LVAPDAVGDLAATVSQVSSDPAYGAAARRMEALIKRQDGTNGGASAVESVLNQS